MVLVGQESKERLEKYGLNEIRKEKQRSPFFTVIRQLKDPLVLILFVAAFISFALGEITDGIIIVAILVLTTIVGFVQEYRSEKAISALIKMTATTCRVLRDSKEKVMDTKYLVPGDIILLYPGDKIPADSYIIEAHNLETNEAPLTGESLPIEKMQTILPKETQIQDRKNILYAITTIANGRGKAVIFETGKRTEIGRITGVVLSITTQKTPFELREVPFTAERKMMITIHRLNIKKDAIFAKGAPEIILNHCNRVLKDGQFLPLTDKIKDYILSANHKMAREGLRVLALASSEVETDTTLVENTNNNDYNNNFLFLGLVGFIDPSRKEVKDAVDQCKTSGINVVMITGDQKFTALAIAEEIGIVNKFETGIDKVIVSGQELDKMNSDSFNRSINDIKIYSRVLPEQKLKIVQTLKNNGHIVAVTGDGVNDAPALKAAHIGVAMGITGTDVVKESASMILADDNFATIVSAIHEGRRIFDNVKKYLVYCYLLTLVKF
jgi:magnesium-transporting ATPase (P-type)